MARVSQEEIFGPVLAAFRAKDFDNALDIANNTEFGLTGAVYQPRARKARAGAARFPRGQSVLESQVHRSVCGRASVRRVQHVGHRLEGGRPRLPAVVHASKVCF